MVDEKQVPLSELLFGPKLDAAAQPEPSLAEVVSVCYREGLASARRGQHGHRSSLPRPPGEPGRVDGQGRDSSR